MIVDSIGVLPLGAPLTVRVKNLEAWHVGLVDRFPSSFSLVKVFFESNSIHSSDDLSTIEPFLLRSFIRGLSSLEKRLFEHEITNLINWVEDASVGARLKVRRDAVLEATEKHQNQLENKKLELSANKTFLELINESLSTLNLRTRDVIEKRLGINSPELTLEEIGQNHGITRERVRQIAKKALRKLERFELWDDIFRDKLNHLFSLHGPAILVEDLGTFDSWFRGFALGKKGGKMFLETFSPDVRLLVFGNDVYLCRKNDEPLLEELVTRVTGLSRLVQVTEEIDKIEALYTVLGVHKPDHYFRTKLETITSEFNRRPSIGTICKNLLEESFEPVDFVTVLTEAIRHGYEKEEVNPLTVQNALSVNGIVVARSPSAYVSKKSIGIDFEIITRFCDRVFDFCSEDFEPGYVFHAIQVVSWNVEINLGIDLGENEWLAVALLQMDEKRRFKANKLKFWLARDYGTRGPDFTVQDLVRRVLKKSGRPMSSRLIASEITKDQFISPLFQIHPKGDLISIGQGYFSLEEFRHEEPLSHGQRPDSYLEEFVRDCLKNSKRWISASFVVEEFLKVQGSSPNLLSVQNALRRNAYLVDGPPAKFSIRENLGLTPDQISYVCDFAYSMLRENFAEGYHAHSDQLIEWIGNKVEIPEGRNLMTAVLNSDFSKRFVVGRAMFSLIEAAENGELRSFKDDAYSVLGEFDNEMPLPLFNKNINKLRFWSEKDRLGVYSAGLSIRKGMIKTGDS